MLKRNRKLLSILAPLANLERLVSRTRQPVIFPFYHEVSDTPLAHVSHLYPLRTQAAFEQDLEEMLRWYEPLSLRDYLDGKGMGAGKRYMVLTFDDGLAGCHRIVGPLLKKKGIPATFFLNNHFIDNRDLFYRHKVSLLLEQIKSDHKVLKAVARSLSIAEKRVEDSILLIGEDQVALLDLLLEESGIVVDHYLKESPVYMNTKQIMELLQWGFEIGGHSPNHADFSRLNPEEISSQVSSSIGDLMHRFQIQTRYFSFPFTSDGIPLEVIYKLLDEGVAEVLLGTAGLKKMEKSGFIQRIPMEEFPVSAGRALKTEYLYYQLKAMAGRNRVSG